MNFPPENAAHWRVGKWDFERHDYPAHLLSPDTRCCWRIDRSGGRLSASDGGGYKDRPRRRATSLGPPHGRMERQFDCTSRPREDAERHWYTEPKVAAGCHFEVDTLSASIYSYLPVPCIVS